MKVSLAVWFNWLVAVVSEGAQWHCQMESRNLAVVGAVDCLIGLVCGDKGSCKLAAEVSKYIYSSSRMLQSKSGPILNPLEISVVF